MPLDISLIIIRTGSVARMKMTLGLPSCLLSPARMSSVSFSIRKFSTAKENVGCPVTRCDHPAAHAPHSPSTHHTSTATYHARCLLSAATICLDKPSFHVHLAALQRVHNSDPPSPISDGAADSGWPSLRPGLLPRWATACGARCRPCDRRWLPADALPPAARGR